jgi:ABC-type glycerol-3-phosphate transport system substrate-binding protein
LATEPAKNTATKITFMSWGGVERFQKWIDTYKSSFPDTASWLTVEAVSGGGGDMDMFSMFRTAMAAGGQGIPDFFESNATNIPEFATRGLMLSIDNYVTMQKEKLLPAAQKVATFNGHMYGVPMQMKTKVWWYRKDMFEKAGIKPEDVKTVDDLINAGKALHGAYPDAYLFNLAPKSSGGWLSMLYSAYADLKFAEGKDAWNITKDERFAQMFDIVKKIYKADIVSPVGDWSTDWSPALTDSKIASIIGPSGASWMAEFLPQFDTKHSGEWGTALWPEFSQKGSEAGGSVWALTTYSKAPDAAFEYLKNFFLTPEGAVIMYKLNGFLPVIESAKEPVKAEAAKKERPAGLTDDQWNMSPVNYFGVDYLDTLFKSQEALVIPPYDMAYGNEMTILGEYCNQYVEDKISLSDALKSAEDEMKTQIVDPYKLG